MHKIRAYAILIVAGIEENYYSLSFVGCYFILDKEKYSFFRSKKRDSVISLHHISNQYSPPQNGCLFESWESLTHFQHETISLGKLASPRCSYEDQETHSPIHLNLIIPKNALSEMEG